MQSLRSSSLDQNQISDVLLFVLPVVVKYHSPQNWGKVYVLLLWVQLVVPVSIPVLRSAYEPVAWMHPDGRIWTFGRGFDKATFTVPLYTAPPTQEACKPAKQPQEPSAGGVLFAVEEAIRNGDCPWQIEQAFDEYAAERRNSLKEGA